LGRSKESPAELLNYASYLPADIASSVPELEAKICIHCAGLASDKESLKNLLLVNTEGTQNVFNHIHADHFIYISSASAYPPNNLLHKEEEVINEADLSGYGLSKRRAELWLQLMATSAKKITVLRPRGVYGTGDRILLPRILRLKKGPFLITPAKLDYTISLTNIENLLLATERIITVDKSYSYELFNITDDPTHLLGDVINSIWEILSKKRNRFIRVPQSIIHLSARLLPLSDLNTNTLKYYLCNHELSNEKIKKEFELELPHNFYNYSPVLEQWIKSVPLKDLQNGAADLPWRK
jgi:nucleoside-diphosphate-sugar epimerase